MRIETSGPQGFDYFGATSYAVGHIDRTVGRETHLTRFGGLVATTVSISHSAKAEDLVSTMKERAEAAGIPIRHFDLQTDERLGVDPYAVWDELHDIGPVFYSTGARGYFVATDFDTIQSVMQDHELWSNYPTTITFTSEQINTDIVPENMDPPVHTAYKKAIIPLLSPKIVKTLQPHAVKVVNELIDKILAKGECDFIEDFATKLPTAFFLNWLGIEDEDEFEYLDSLANEFNELKSAESHANVVKNIAEVMGNLLDSRRVNPKDDLATHLVNLKINGEPMDDDKIKNLGNFLLVAGNDTTSNVLGNVMWHIARFPQDRDRLRAEPELIPDAIEELIRYYTTVGPSGRTAKAYGELHGCAIEPGDRVFMARASADRALFDSVDIDREWTKHSAFGIGPHRCVGSHVARMELKNAFEIWLERIPEFRVPEDFVPKFKWGSFQQNLVTLPLIIS